MSDELKQLQQTIYNNDNNNEKINNEKTKRNSNLNFLPQILRELAEKEILYHFLPNGHVYLGNFFKKGDCSLVFTDNGIYLIDKKKVENKIESIEDILEIYYNAWLNVYEKKKAEPDPNWLNLMIEYDLVEKITIYKPKL